jgi:hypothetical protein
MADLVVSNGVGYKRRNPWGVWALGAITFGIYHLVWYYKVNNELRNYGENVDPTLALLAVVLGWIIIVPPFVSFYRTAQRIYNVQERAGAGERMIPVLGLILWFFHVAVSFAPTYYQSQINKAWGALAASGAQVMPA